MIRNLVATGLYGTLAYAVSRRAPEVGLRMALGAQRGQVLWMVLRGSLGMTVAGGSDRFAAGSGGHQGIAVDALRRPASRPLDFRRRAGGDRRSLARGKFDSSATRRVGRPDGRAAGRISMSLLCGYPVE